VYRTFACDGELLVDGFKRLAEQDWMRKLNLQPRLLNGNAIDLLTTLETLPDCIYLDPMFPLNVKNPH